MSKKCLLEIFSNKWGWVFRSVFDKYTDDQKVKTDREKFKGSDQKILIKSVTVSLILEKCLVIFKNALTVKRCYLDL